MTADGEVKLKREIDIEAKEIIIAKKNGPEILTSSRNAYIINKIRNLIKCGTD